MKAEVLYICLHLQERHVCDFSIDISSEQFLFDRKFLEWKRA